MKSQILFNSVDNVWREITGTFCPLQSLGLETCHRKKGEVFLQLALFSVIGWIVLVTYLISDYLVDSVVYSFNIYPLGSDFCD